MVEIHYADWKDPMNLSEIELTNWLTLVCKQENKELLELNIVFSSDAYLLSKNKELLNHDYFTDIIALDFCIGNQVIGDLFISVERVRENALKQNESFETELKRVMVHGVLHLCGYSDKTDNEAKTIRTKEDFYLSL